MKKPVAVVFDSAGTLLRMYRVAKDMSTGSVLENIETTMLVAQKPCQALVVLRTRFEELGNCDPQMKLHDFIEHYRISLGISCSSSPFRLEDVYRIIGENSTKISDINQVVSIVRNRCPAIFYLAAGLIVDSRENSVPYVLSTGGQMYSETSGTIKSLREMGADIYIASGDDAKNVRTLATYLDIPSDNVFAVATTHEKEHIITSFKEKYEKVLMVGDGMNDILALRAADVGVLTSQQGDSRPEALINAADVTVSNITDVVDIVKNIYVQITS